MSLFRVRQDEDNSDLHYKGDALLRMLAYVKPHWKPMALCLLMVLGITLLELYKPIIIGDAIDQYITQESPAPGTELVIPDGATEEETAALIAANQDARFAGILRASGMYVLVLVLLFLLNREIGRAHV